MDGGEIWRLRYLFSLHGLDWFAYYGIWELSNMEPRNKIYNTVNSFTDIFYCLFLLTVHVFCIAGLVMDIGECRSVYDKNEVYQRLDQ